MRFFIKVNKQKLLIIIIIVIIFLTILKTIQVFTSNTKNNKIIINNNNDDDDFHKIEAVELHENDEEDVLKLFDLTKPLTTEYDKIPCRKSKEIIIQTTLCVHDLNKDSYVSSSIWSQGVWEEDIVTSILNYLNKNPDWLFLDVGAQIGQYSLYAAKLGRKVLTVEPFYDNIIRLHKAAKNESIGDRITLVTNAISNKRGEIKLLQPEASNIGGQSLVQNKDKIFKLKDLDKNDPNYKYYVQTILFDDIVKFLPLDNNGNKFSKALLKIDIEAFEPYAFQHASKLFDTLDISIIFMEWGNLPKQLDMHKEIEDMIDFLLSRGLVPYSGDKVLEKKDWKTGWSWDIIWRKNGF